MKKSFWRRLFFPPAWVTGLLCLLCAALLALVFLRGIENQALAVAIYALSFYALCLLFLFCLFILPPELRRLRSRLYARPLFRRCMSDAAFRTHAGLFASLGVNLMYVGMNVLAWFMYRSMWFVVLGAYYAVLALIRFLLLRFLRANEPGRNPLAELSRARLCAFVLLLLNFTLTGAVMMILYAGKGFEYPGVLIYAVAAFTFYITLQAIVSLIKYRTYRSPVITTAKIISLCASFVSMLALETAMLSQFGADMPVGTRHLFIALTGAFVSAAVISLSLYMIVKCSKEIRELKQNDRKK